MTQDIRDTSQLRKAMKPWVFQWLQEAGLLDSGGGYGSSVVGGGGAPSPHDLSSVHHTGTLGDDQAPQFLKLDGSRTLTGNLDVNPGITIDGVDLSAHAANADAHHTAFVGLQDDFGSPINPDGSDRISVVSLDPLLFVSAGISQLQLDLDASSNPGASAKLLKTDASGGLILDGILELNGTITSTGDLVLDPIGNDVTPVTGYELNLGTRLKPFLAAHIAELQVGTLVAKEEIATVGGSLFVAPTNILTADLAASGTPVPTDPPVREDEATYTSGTFTVTSVPLTVPADATEGSLALAAVVYRSNTITITGVPGGWTPRGVFVHAASGQTIAIYSRVLTLTDVTNPRPTYTWTLSSFVAAVGAMVVIDDFDPSDPYDIDVVWKQGASGTSVVADSQTTTSDQTYYLFFGVSASNCTFTPPGGMDEVVDITTSTGGSNIALTIAEEVRATAGATGSRTATASASANTMSVVLAITPLPGAIASSVSVKYNNLQLGDTVFLRKTGTIEFMRVASAASGSGPYTYTMYRDLDGSGMNAWVAGDAIMNTGGVGAGFIDLYAEQGINAPMSAGPSIVFHQRHDTTYNGWRERSAIGNLDGLYDYATPTFGAAFGDPTSTWMAIDEAQGLRILNGSDLLAEWDAAGNISLGIDRSTRIGAGGISVYDTANTAQVGLYLNTATDVVGAFRFLNDPDLGNQIELYGLTTGALSTGNARPVVVTGYGVLGVGGTLRDSAITVRGADPTLGGSKIGLDADTIAAGGLLTVSGHVRTGVAGSVGGALTLYPNNGTSWFHLHNNSANAFVLSHGASPGSAALFSVTNTGTVNTVGAYHVNGTQVVGGRLAAITAPAATIADCQRAINDIRSRLQTHGLTF